MDIDPILVVLVPTLSIVTGVFSWFIRGRLDEGRAIRDKLRAEQRERYAQILNPYIQLFANPNAQEEAIAVMTSQQYRKEVFDFALVDESFRGSNSPDGRPGRVGGVPPVPPLAF